MKWKVSHGIKAEIATITAVAIPFIMFGAWTGPITLAGIPISFESGPSDIGCPDGDLDGPWSDLIHKNLTIETETEDLDFDKRKPGGRPKPIIAHPDHPIVNRTDWADNNTVWLGLRGGSGGKIEGAYWFSIQNPAQHSILVKVALNHSASHGEEWLLDYVHYVSVRGDGNHTRVLYKNGDEKHDVWCIKLKPEGKADIYVDILLKADDDPYYVLLVHDEIWRPWVPKKS